MTDPSIEFINENLMKRIVFYFACIVSATSANAFDRWVDDKYKGGETVYSAGVAQVLVIGARGFGIAINPNTEGHVVSKEITIKIDDGEALKLPIQHVAVTTYQIKNNDNLVEKVANAKKVEITYNLCGGTANGCAFTFKGNPRTAIWEFDSTLSKQYPDYLTTIKQP